MDDLHPTDDHSHKFFIWPEWIAANGPLNATTAFEYFTTSMFYDKESNNQVLRMQTMYAGLPLVNEAEELKRFTGIEFALVHAEPPLFVIHKRHRFSRDEVRPLTAYFIIHNRIYQSPDVYSVLSNRLLTTIHSLQSSLDTLRNYRPDFAPRTGFVWPIMDNQANASANKPATRAQSMLPGEAASGEARITESSEKPASREKKQENLALMFNAMRTTAAHIKTTSASKLNENLAAMADTPPVIASPSGPPDTGLQVDTPGTIISSNPSSETLAKEAGAPIIKKKRKKTAPQTPA